MNMPERQAWRALAALCIGFFMILLDQTVVAVATPQFQAELGASINQVVWVTSIYLLMFAVPLLVTGRLGDRFGQRNVYLVGMVIFTLSSLACGLASNIVALIVARAAQGLGASIMAPQTMSVINRVFARDRRGAAMGMWGAVAGLATLTGPILGGIIVARAGFIVCRGFRRWRRRWWRGCWMRMARIWRRSVFIARCSPICRRVRRLR